MSITTNEKAVLKAIAENFFSYDISDWVWADCINDSETPSGVTGKTLSGVCSSLVKKDLIHSSGSGKDACVALTKNGIAAVDSF